MQFVGLIEVGGWEWGLGRNGEGGGGCDGRRHFVGSVRAWGLGGRSWFLERTGKRTGRLF